MAQILDIQGLQHYANKMCNADNRKVGTKSLPTALNDIDTAIDGFKKLFETEYSAPINIKITNHENLFPIGTGANIDKRNDMQNSFTDIMLNGDSLLNCIKENSFSNPSNFFESENDPIINGGEITLISRGSVNQTRFSLKPSQGIIKPNTKYTLVFDVLKNTLSGQMYLTYTNNGSTCVSYFPVQNSIDRKATGRFKYVLTSANTNIEQINCLFRTMIWNNSVAGESITFTVRIFEGDWTNKKIPEYFEGLKSVGEQKNNNHKINIWSENKNLWKLDQIRTQNGAIPLYTRNHNEIIYTSVGEFGIYSPIKVKAGQTLKISGIVENVQNIRLFKQADNFQGGGVYNKDFNGVKTEVSPNYSYTFTEDGIYHIRVWCKSTGQARLVNFLAEISNNNTEYDEYRSDNKTVLLKQPLRGLPNGVKDTIEKVHGEWKIVRRCGEVIFDGSQTVTGTSNLINSSAWSKFGYQLEDCKDYSDVICDSLAYQTDKSGVNPDLGECVGCTNNMWKILFQIKKNNNILSTVAEVNDYMKKNPKKVIYELTKPIVEDIDPITLQCWKNGTITIDEAIPVETTHTVALNRSAQIQNNIEELTSLRNRIKTLEEQYSKTVLNQAYEAELLKLDMKLDDVI